MNDIIAFNHERIRRKIYKIKSFDFRKAGIGEEKRFVLPDITDVLPKQSVHLRKAADHGTLITDTLKDRLTKNLREVLLRPDYTKISGKTAGTMKPQILDDFRKSVVDTFNSYVKKDPTFQMPNNIEAITRTEVRSVVDDVKHTYMGKFLENNPNYGIRKKWIHNKMHRKYKPRVHHLNLHGIIRKYDEDFEYVNPVNNILIKTPFPHAPGMPASEVIGCSCEIQYLIIKLNPKQKISSKQVIKSMDSNNSLKNEFNSINDDGQGVDFPIMEKNDKCIFDVGDEYIIRQRKVGDIKVIPKNKVDKKFWQVLKKDGWYVVNL